MTRPRLRAQHGSAISPADPELVAAVAERLSALAPSGESFTTPDRDDGPETRAFARRARDWSGRRVRIMPRAQIGACHGLAAAFVAADPLRYRHVYGYALDQDSHWRTHSWVLDRQTGGLIEPTPIKRQVYIGVALYRSFSC